MEESKNIINNQLANLEQEKINLEQEKKENEQYVPTEKEINRIKQKTLLEDDNIIQELLKAHKGDIKKAINDYYTYKLNILLDICDYDDANMLVNMLRECKGDEKHVETQYFQTKLEMLKKQTDVSDDEGHRLLRKHYGNLVNCVLESYGMPPESKKRSNNMKKSFFNPDEMNKLFTQFNNVGLNDDHNTNNTDNTNDNNNNENTNNNNNINNTSTNTEKSGSLNNLDKNDGDNHLNNENENKYETENILKYNVYKNIFNNTEIISILNKYNSYSYIKFSAYASNYTKRKTYNNLLNILEEQLKLNNVEELDESNINKEEYIKNKHNDVILFKLNDSIFTSFLNGVNLVFALFNQQIKTTTEVKNEGLISNINQNATKLFRQYNALTNEQCIVGDCLVIDNFIYE